MSLIPLSLFLFLGLASTHSVLGWVTKVEGQGAAALRRRN